MNDEKEIWKVWKDTRSNNIKNTRGVLWEVSDQGKVKKNGVLYECKLNRGYKVFGCNYKVHRAVAELFIPNHNNYNEVDHINANKLDNKAVNLRWVTHKQNCNNLITRKRNSESKKGKPRSEETIHKIRESMKGKQNAKGKTQSEETRKRRSESMKRYWQNKKLNTSM